MTRVLILSAAIGEGHDLPARELAAGLAAQGAEAEIVDGLAAMGSVLEKVIIEGSPFGSKWGSLLFDVEWWLFMRVRPTRALASALIYLLGAKRLMKLIARKQPDVIVSTWPGTTEVLGRLRAAGRLRRPVVSAITDLAALRWWSHPGVDLHLITHPESTEEVREIAPRSRIVPVRGLNSPAFLEPRDRAEARRELGLPAEAPIVVVSGGGWAVGDLEGAIDTALAVDGTHVVAMTGRNEGVRTALESDYAGDDRVEVLGFTDRVSDLFAAADALVHSTAGLTVLEALVRGCATVSYGWGVAHIRVNNRAFQRFGLADVAPDRKALGPALQRALAEGREPDLSFAELPSAASEVLALAR